MSNIYDKPYEPGAIAKRSDSNPTTATRVAAHKEQQTNNLAPVNNSMAKPNMGKLGFKGDGQTK